MGGTTGGRTRLSALIVLGTILVVLLANAALAFDGKRTGFIAGAGGGFGLLGEDETFAMSSYSPYHDNEPSDWVDHHPLYMNFRYGYAPTEQFSIYWSYQAGTLVSEHRTWLESISGLGASYYMKSTVPSVFVGLVTGFATRSTFYEDYDESIGGVGTSISVGYEFRKHWEVEFTAWAGRPSELYRYFRVAGVALQVRLTAY